VEALSQRREAKMIVTFSCLNCDYASIYSPESYPVHIRRPRTIRTQEIEALPPAPPNVQLGLPDPLHSRPELPLDGLDVLDGFRRAEASDGCGHLEGGKDGEGGGPVGEDGRFGEAGVEGDAEVW
jgi:hypothetical protein